MNHKGDDEYNVINDVDDEDTFLYIWNREDELLARGDFPKAGKDTTWLLRLENNSREQMDSLKLSLMKR